MPTEGSTRRSGYLRGDETGSAKPWRRSSVGQSIRLIIGRSSVRDRSPLPNPINISIKETGEGLHEQGEIRAEQAARQHWHDGSHRPRQDDVDSRHLQDLGGEGFGQLHAVRSDRQGARGEGAWYH